MKKLAVVAIVVSVIALGVGGWALWRTFDLEDDAGGGSGAPTTTVPLVTVPSLIGKPGLSGVVLLNSLSLKAEVVQVPSVDVPDRMVISQDPESDTEVPPGTVVELKVSSGPP